MSHVSIQYTFATDPYLAIAFSASSQLQLMLTLAFPDGNVKWGGSSLTSKLYRPTPIRLIRF